MTLSLQVFIKLTSGTRTSLKEGFLTSFYDFVILFLLFHLQPNWMDGYAPALSLWSGPCIPALSPSASAPPPPTTTPSTSNLQPSRHHDAACAGLGSGDLGRRLSEGEEAWSAAMGGGGGAAGGGVGGGKHGGEVTVGRRRGMTKGWSRPKCGYHTSVVEGVDKGRGKYVISLGLEKERIKENLEMVKNNQNPPFRRSSRAWG
jgi:hypothetical protein